MTAKKETKPKKERIDIHVRKYVNEEGVYFNRGDKCEVTDTDELERLTEMGAIKSTFVEV